MKQSLIFAIVLTSLYSYGQKNVPDKSIIQKPFIEVTGTASKEVIPDKIFISIILSEKVINNEKYTIQVQEEKLKKALAKININASNLFLSDITSEINKDKKKETGFKVTKGFSLQVKSSDEVSNVFKELYAINIKESSIIKTEHSKIDSLRKDVRIAAIKAAKEKAEYLLTAIGEQIVKPIEIKEQEEYPNYLNAFSNNILSINT